MNISSISSSLATLKSSVSTLVLGKAMGFESQSAATLLEDMAAAIPTPAQTLAPKAGSLDVRI